MNKLFILISLFSDILRLYFYVQKVKFLLSVLKNNISSTTLPTGQNTHLSLSRSSLARLSVLAPALRTIPCTVARQLSSSLLGNKLGRI